MIDISNELSAWLSSEKQAGRLVDKHRLEEHIQQLIHRHNTTPHSHFNGLTPKEMYGIVYTPFSEQCVVQLKVLEKDQYDRIPLVRQTLYLLKKLGENELKLTKLGWLPSKIVAEVYQLGQPEWVVEEFGAKRYFEYDVKSVWMSRVILEQLGWIKTRKGILSLTVKGKKALLDPDGTANEILLSSITGGVLHIFDRFEDERIGNFAIAYSVWLLNSYGSEWHTGNFYSKQYKKAFDIPANYRAYEVRIFSRLFYWLGFVEQRLRREGIPPFSHEYKRTDLVDMIFSFKKSVTTI